MRLKISKEVILPRSKQSPWISLFLYSLPPSIYEEVGNRDECQRNFDKIEKVFKSLTISFYRHRVKLCASKKLRRYENKLEIVSLGDNPQLVFTINIK